MSEKLTVSIKCWQGPAFSIHVHARADLVKVWFALVSRIDDAFVFDFFVGACDE